MSWLLRLALYIPIMWLIMVVYAGLKETTARDTARSASRKTVKAVVWTVGLVGVMFAIEWLFID